MSYSKRVLSIQSHVVHGYVGNKCATFPLQVLGFEVDTINSVQFCNHKGYSICKGQILDASDIGELYSGLKENGLLSYSHLLTGFVGSKSFLMKIEEIVKDMKKENPHIQYVCDPVMGDNGKMYVPEELLPVYKERIIPLADVLTPNQFEAELLTGMKITDITSAKAAMQKLHDMGAKNVVISSSDLGNKEILVGLGSSISNGTRTGIKLDIPLLPAVFTGTGDLFSALLLAWLHKHSNDIQLACEKTVSTMQHILTRTLKQAQELAGPGQTPTKAQLEPRIIQSKADIENPALVLTASAL